ncbi:hypothetical protein [Kitasatospora sp. NPDC059160]|uniref:hypothetical protein n=1 Tax=Kitasatospora sp. NPDC059160 TaxID=3346748 RepID=UPI0036A4EE33
MPSKRVPDAELLIRRKSAKGESKLDRKTITIPHTLVAEVESLAADATFSAVTTEALRTWVATKKRRAALHTKGQSESESDKTT